jgi:SMP-30/Gluconolactonase/LRE-like region
MLQVPRFALGDNGALRIWALALIAGAAVCCLLVPPLVAFRPQPLPALGGVAAGGAMLLWPLVRPSLRHWMGWGVAAGGTLGLWMTIAWCILSQMAPITQPIGFTWSLRGLPIMVVAAIWLWLMLARDWQRRTLLAVALPSMAGLALVAWTGNPLRPVNFQPYYVAVDSHGTIYVTDAASPVIRVFGPGGSLRAKLRPGLASRQGPPGPGFSQPGPYNDPERLGVPRTSFGSTSVSGSLRPWAPGIDDFWFCGMALDSYDNLYVPDWMHSRMLRFAPSGQLMARWPLPQDYHPSLGCVTAGPDNTLYLSDEHGVILRLDAQGRVLARWALPEAIVGGISIAPGGRTLYALALTHVYQIEPGGGVMKSWPLPIPTGSLGRPYQGILATTGGRVLVSNLAMHRVDVYCASVTDVGRACGHIGSGGIWPGQFGQVGGMARDNRGDLYIADFDHRVLQRFASNGAVVALYWGPDDDEVD